MADMDVITRTALHPIRRYTADARKSDPAPLATAGVVAHLTDYDRRLA